MRRVVVGVLFVALITGCAKLSDTQKQAASDIASGLAGVTGKALATDTAGLVGPAPSGATSKMGQMVEGALWAFRFKVLENPAVGLRNHTNGLVTLPGTVCDDETAGVCTSSCPTTSSFKEACTFGSTETPYVCNGNTYNFTNGTLSITADFASTTGTYGSATGNFALNVTIGGSVNGGAFEGKSFECSMNFTVDVAGLDHGTVSHFTPDCTNFSCKYDGKDLSCEDVQSKMATSTISCT